MPFAFLILILLANTAMAQSNRDSLYYNAAWELTEKPFAQYLRVTTVEDDAGLYFSGPVRDYYKNGKLEMEGTYGDAGKKEGKFRFYHSSGKLKCEGDFVNDKPTGTWSFFYGDGLPKAEVFFKDDDFVFLEYSDSAKTPGLENGNGKFKWWVNNATFPYGIIKGKYKDGKRSGTWKFYTRESYAFDNSVWEEDYEDGKFKMGYLTAFKNNPKVDASIFKFKFMIPEKFEKTEEFVADFYLRNSGNGGMMHEFVVGKQEPLFINRTGNFEGSMQFLRKVLNSCSNLFDHTHKKYDGKLTFLIDGDGRIKDLKIDGDLDTKDREQIQFLMAKFRNLKTPGDDKVAIDAYHTIYLYSYNLHAIFRTNTPVITKGNLLFSERSFTDFIKSIKETKRNIQ